MTHGCLLLLSAIHWSADELSEEGLTRDRWQKAYANIAQSITMRCGELPLAMLEQPLRFYTNPVRSNDQHGAIFLWSDKGRPVVIGSIWSAVNRQNPDARIVTHEWLSLSENPSVAASRNERKLWTSGEPGVVWEQLKNAPPPAASRSQRLVQMRTIARRYSASIQIEGESDLRLLPQPLYRYPEQVGNSLDGAIFDFAMTTDPELLVLLEANEVAGAPTWQIAFARFGNKGMTVKEGDRVVWSCQAGTPGLSDGKYYLRWRAEEMPSQPPIP